MKYLSLLLLFCWSFYSLKTMPNLRPSEDIHLWLLCAFTFIYVAVNLIITFVDLSKGKK